MPPFSPFFNIVVPSFMRFAVIDAISRPGMFIFVRLFRNFSIVLGSLTLTPSNKGEVFSNEAILAAPTSCITACSMLSQLKPEYWSRNVSSLVLGAT